MTARDEHNVPLWRKVAFGVCMVAFFALVGYMALFTGSVLWGISTSWLWAVLVPLVFVIGWLGRGILPD